MDILTNGRTLIQSVYNAGAEITLDRDKLRVQPVSILPKKLLVQLQTSKSDIIQTLKHYPIPLIRKAYRIGVFEQGYSLEESEIIKLIPPSDWNDVFLYSDYELRPWAKAIALRAIRHRGIVPKKWNKVARCSQCGWIFSFSTGECESCPWCEVRTAGVRFPTPGLNRCAHPKLIGGRVIQECEIQSDNIGVIIRQCFFCGEQHMHGTSGKDWETYIEVSGGNRHLGHRQCHCVRKGIEITLTDGTIVCSEQGYYLGIGDQQPNVSN